VGQDQLGAVFLVEVQRYLGLVLARFVRFPGQVKLNVSGATIRQY
jgi:hypothetical protein